MTRFARHFPLPILVAAVTMLGGQGRAAAQEADTRWAPWVGCWQAVADEDTPAGAGFLCVRHAGGGVEVIEVVEGQPGTVQTLVADGRPYDVATEGCEGWRSVEFSLDGQRLYTRSEQACSGDPLTPSTGLIAMVSPSEWIDVQATDVNGRALSWARRYRPAPPETVEAAGFADLTAERGFAIRAARAAASAPDIDDVLEATRAVDAEAVRAWVAELNDPFDLDARRLIRLADAGVPESVIDVMVAVSFPDRFSIDRTGNVDELATSGSRRGYAYGGRPVLFGWGNRDPFYYSPFGYGYRYGSRYGYEYGYPYDYYSPGVVIVAPREDAEPRARVVRGRGYTRGRPNGTGSTSGSPASAPSVRKGNEGASDTGEPSGSGASSGAGTSGASEGRRAKPRER